MSDLQGDSAEESIHYSSVFTLSVEDIQKIRESITANIGGWVQVIKDSTQEEQIYSMAIDFFRVDRPR